MTAAPSPKPALASANRPAKRQRRIGMWFARGTLSAIFAISAFLTVTPWGRASVRATLMLQAVISAGLSSSPATSDPAVTHTTLTVPSISGDVYLDLYEPNGPPPLIPGSRPGFVLISGLGDNRPIPQLINLADAFARNGVVVATMTTNALLDYQLTPTDQDAVVQAFQILARRPGINPHAIGLVGFSAGGGIASLGAADPRISDQVAYLLMFGSYADATNLLRDVGRRALTDGAQTIPWQPDPVPVQALANSVAPLLPGGEGVALHNAFANGFNPIPAPILATFAPQTQAAYHLLAGDEPDQADANIARLTPDIRRLLAALSPAAHLAAIHAPIYLMHDRHDPFVPYTESQAFAAQLARAGHAYDYATFDIFAHVEVRGGANDWQLAGDGVKLERMLYDILQHGA